MIKFKPLKNLRFLKIGEKTLKKSAFFTKAEL